MAIIGTFTRQDNGSYIGSLDTLTLKGRLTFEPLSRRGKKSPDFRITSGLADLGAAWEHGSDTNSYLSVRLDDPGFAAPINCRLTKTGTERVYSLIWERERKRS